jgi:hypothetical protein
MPGANRSVVFCQPSGNLHQDVQTQNQTNLKRPYLASD